MKRLLGYMNGTLQEFMGDVFDRTFFVSVIFIALIWLVAMFSMPFIPYPS